MKSLWFHDKNYIILSTFVYLYFIFISVTWPILRVMTDGVWKKKNLDLKFAHFEHKLILKKNFFIVILFLLLLLLLLWQQWINCPIHSTYTPIACIMHHITSHNQSSFIGQVLPELRAWCEKRKLNLLENFIKWVSRCCFFLMYFSVLFPFFFP